MERMNRSGRDDIEDYGWISTEPSRAHAYLWPSVARLLEGRVNVGDSILDIGCGNGFLAAELAKCGFRVSGIDASRDGVMLARRAYPDIRFEVASVYDDLSFLGTKWDAVVSTEVIEHLYYPRKLLQGARRVLKPGGVLVLSTPYHGYVKNLALSVFDKWDEHHDVFWDGGHIKFFSQQSLSRMLLEEGFSSIEFCNAGRVRWLWKSMVCIACKSPGKT
jgi:2-polyprenyl-3-methyl-5-hydroxy-6-metoxy-1,4-benzoquinol methylase